MIRTVSMKQLASWDKNPAKASLLDCRCVSGKTKWLVVCWHSDFELGYFVAGLVSVMEQFERTSQFEKAMATVDQIKSRKKLQCLISIKNRSLCECLSTNLPFTLHISNYVSIANQDKGR